MATLRVPVEFKFPIAELEKQLLKSFVEQAAPGAKPELPVVLLGDDRGRAGGGPIPGALLPAPANRLPQLEDPFLPLPDGQPLVPAPRRQLIPRRPGERPLLDRLAQRPLVAAAAGRLADLLDTGHWVELRSFRVTVEGNTLTSRVGIALRSEGPDPRTRRDLPVKLTVRRDLAWAQTGRLQLVGGTSRVEIDPVTEIIGFPRLDVRRVALANHLLGLLNGAIDRELARRLPTEKLPDLKAIAPQLREKLPALALVEVTAYPVRGQGDDLVVALVVGLAPAQKGLEPEVQIRVEPGPPPPPTIRGRVVIGPDGKPDIKLEPAS